MTQTVLVTTGLEGTLGTDGPIIFLGEWAKVFLTESDLKGRESTTLRYHWHCPKKFADDYQQLTALYEDRLKALSEALNTRHQTREELRYWRVLIGPWLMYFIHILFDRYAMLELSSRYQKPLHAFFICNPQHQFIPHNFREFQMMMTTDIWNNSLYKSLVDFFPHITPIELESPTKLVQWETASAEHPSPLRNIKQWLWDVTTGVSKASSDIVFYGHYLPRSLIIQAKLRLGQFPLPTSPSPVSLPKYLPDQEQRDWVLGPSPRVNNFERILNFLIARYIPTIYLEGYSDLLVATRSNNWPRRPAFIFTGNKWLDDDFFKAWTASKLREGTRLIVNQHGGAHGTARHMSIEDHQLKIADHFLSWGWGKGGQILPYCNTKTIGRRPRLRNTTDEIVLVTSVWPRYSYWLSSVPQSSKFLDYLEHEFQFVEQLPHALFSLLKIRLPAADYGWDQRGRWKARFPGIMFDDKSIPYLRSASDSLLTIHTYNSTTFLESLSLNIPTLICFPFELFEIREEAKKPFQTLRDAKIYHPTPESAAEFLVDDWDKLNSWWQDPSTQLARSMFCAAYAREEKSPVKSLVKIFQSARQSDFQN